MRSDAKRPTAGSNLGQAKGCGHFFRGSFANRGASRASNGSGAPAHRPAQVVVCLLAAFVVLATLAPSATAVMTRAKTATFGAIPGSCSGAALATGTGDLNAATGVGNLNVLGAGTGDRKSGSNLLQNVKVESGSFSGGEAISGPGIPAGTTIASFNEEEGRLNLSKNATSNGTGGGLFSGSKAVTNLSTSSGGFAVGMSIFGNGIPSGTTVTATGSGMLTLSTGVTSAAGAVVLSAGTTEITSVSESCGSFEVGQALSGDGIPAGSTITEVGAGTLTISKTVTTPGTGVGLSAFSKFGDPGRLAVDQASERLYVYDSNAGPASIHAFGLPGLTLTGGAFPLTVAAGSENSGIGVDNTALGSAGNIYYATNISPRRIFGFDSTGAPLGGSFPVSLGGSAGFIPCGAPGVDSLGNLFVADFGSDLIRRYDATGAEGTPINTSGQGSPCNVAFASNDDMLVAMHQGPVWKYTAASGYSSASAVQILSGGNRAITVDTATDTLYAAQSSKVSVHEIDGTPLYSFAGGIPGSTFNGVGVDQGADAVYVADGGSNNDKVYRFGAAQDYADATATLNPATNVNFFSADISATIDDNNAQQTTWRLEISKDGGGSWSTVSSGQTAGGQTGVLVKGTATGLAIETEYSFRVVTNKGAEAGTEVASPPLTFETPELPDATGAPAEADEITDVSARLNATITDNSVMPTRWRLELSGDDGSTWTAVSSGQTAGGLTEALVSGTAIGLDPNTPYKFRVVTNKGTTAASEVASLPLGFKTTAPPPVITDVGAVQVSDTSARLVGTIDPRNNPTGYVFEYGTTPALGSTTKPVNIGGGATPITVSQVVKGLVPGTTHYFRLVATNLTGSSASPSQSFTTRTNPFPPANPGNCPNQARRAEQGSTHLPDCRAYEMVSPPDKNQGSVVGKGNAAGVITASISEDGEAVGFCTGSLFGEPPGQLPMICAQYISHRGPGGWTTEAPLPRFCASDPLTGVGGVFAGSRNVLLATQSFERYAVAMPEFAGCEFFPLTPGAPADSVNVYRGDLGAQPTGFELLTPSQSVGFGQNQAWPVGGSDDLSHVVFATLTNQTADSPPQDDSYYKLYDWAELGAGDCSEAAPSFDPALGGCLELVGKDPGGAAFAADIRLPAYNLGAANNPIPSAVSDDGERIYFQSPASGGSVGYGNCTTAACNVYLREAGATTNVSTSECTGPCGVESAPDAFQWATDSGDKALFVSCAALTDASAEGVSGCGNVGSPSTEQNLKLYRWERNAPPGGKLVDLTVDGEPADGSQPKALDIVGASEDGDTVYFVAGGQIVAGEPTHANLKLYRWRWNGGSPLVEYLAPYVSTLQNGSASSTTQATSDPNTDRNHVRVTPDGRYVVIQTTLPLDAAADRDSDHDMYRWGEDDGWTCVSCQLPGTPSLGGVTSSSPILYYNALYGDLGVTVPEHRISDDGQRIFFSTPDPLVSQDTNHEAGCPRDDAAGFASEAVYECADVYQWHDGTVSLITSGSGGDPFILLGATADGGEVFFATAQQLSGWDQDTQADFYVARTGGGFREPPPAPPECEGEGCRGPASDAAEVAGAGTAVFQGAGNPKAEAQGRRCPANRLRRGKRCLTVRAIARKRCRRLKGTSKRRCVRKQARRLRRAQRGRGQRRAQKRRIHARANTYRRATR